MKMGKEVLILDDTVLKLKKNKSYTHKDPIFKKYVDIKRVLASNKIS